MVDWYLPSGFEGAGQGQNVDHARQLRRMARRSFIGGVVLGALASAAIVAVWQFDVGSAALLLGLGALIGVLSIALLGLSAWCAVVLTEGWVRTRTVRRGAGRQTARVAALEAPSEADPPSAAPEALPTERHVF